MPQQRGWTPASLRRITFACFAGLFAAIAVSLAVLNVISHRNNGLCNAQAKDHYLWTYAPTAVFTLLAAVWSQVEYRAKQMEPWRLMASGPKAASESVLLDYISTWNVIVLFKSLKRRQVIVATTVSASLLLQLLIVLSTGLFTLSEREIHEDGVQIQLKDSFYTNYLDVPGGYDEGKLDQRPAALLMGVVQENVSLPAGTTMEAAFQRFSTPAELGSDVQLSSAVVQVLSSSVDCEKADVKVSSDGAGGVQIASIHAPKCGRIDTTYNGPQLQKGQISGWMVGPSCPIDQTTSTSILFAFVGTFESIDTGNYTAIACTPSYSVRKLSVVNQRSSDIQVQESGNASSTHISGFDTYELVTAWTDAISEAGSLMPTGSLSEWEWFRKVFPEPSLSELNDYETLTTYTQRAWSAFTAQFFSFYWRAANRHSVLGSSVSLQNRLVIRSVSFWLAEACLVLLFVACIGLGVTRPTKLVPRDLSSIAGLATVLSSSKRVVAELHGTGSATETELQGLLSAKAFRTIQPQSAATVSTSYSIELGSKTTKDDWAGIWKERIKPGVCTWYRPVTATYYYRLGIPIGIIAMVITLELLLRRSKHSDGIVDVSASASYEHYAWTFLPALAMLLISLLVAMQFETAQVFGAYSALSTGLREARSTVMRRSFGLYAIWTSLLNLELFVIFSVTSLFISQFLTIVVSGLFSSVAISSIGPISIAQRDWFAHATATTSETGLQIDMVLNGNMSYPRFTYDTLALSQPELPSGRSKGKVNVALPSLRGQMNCSLVPDDKIYNTSITFGESQYENSPQIISVSLDVFPKCRQERLGLVVGRLPGDANKHELLILAPESGYFGGLLHLDDSECPTYTGAFGKVSKERIIEMTMFTCLPFAERVMANVSLILPDGDIDIATPPIVNESTSEPFDLTFIGSGWPLYFADGLFVFASNFFLDNVFDGFMETLVLGSRGIPPIELSGPQNTAKLLESVSHVYAQAFAQLMDNFRVPLSNPGKVKLDATLTHSSTRRLQQSAIATRILESLLGTILVLFIMATFTMKTRKVLPKNPCSIAAVASLLADSDFLRLIKPEYQWLSDKELAARLKAYKFSMGWWSGAEGDVGQRRFGIDYGAAEHLR